jgi:hypothetical protein
MTTVNKALFTDETGRTYSQTFYDLQNEAENKAMKQHYTGTEDEVDEQEAEYALSYLADCYQACDNVPEVKGECIDFHQWLDWLQYGYFI